MALANAAEVVGAGAGGVAVVSAVFDATDVASATVLCAVRLGARDRRE